MSFVAQLDDGLSGSLVRSARSWTYRLTVGSDAPRGPDVRPNRPAPAGRLSGDRRAERLPDLLLRSAAAAWTDGRTSRPAAASESLSETGRQNNVEIL
jgi:hypothetical protein